MLVLDGNQRSALAVTRSLGARGIEVIVADVTATSLAGCSRHALGCATYPDPATAPSSFVQELARLVRAHDIGVLLPMTDVTTALVLRHRDAFSTVHVPFPAYATYENLVNKQKVMALARSLGVPVPLTHVIHAADDRFAVQGQVRFPVVIKPVYSKVQTPAGWISAGVQYADSADELEAKLSEHPCLGVVPLLVQQRISGHGHGIFALYDHGRPIAYFAHRRLRERPPSGGVSVLSESIALHPASLHFAEALLSQAAWHGVAMVEFKVDAQGTPYLMEVNGRFWGSLQLAVDAGVDFPLLLYRIATGESVERQNGYAFGCRNRWLLGDLDHLYWVLWKERHRYTIGQRLRALGEFMKLYQRRTRYEVNRLDDWRPFLHELRGYFLGA
ncbi:MAG: ATP-grasp domain-containing protein [Thiohalomonadaceae bacterium]